LLGGEELSQAAPQPQPPQKDDKQPPQKDDKMLPPKDNDMEKVIVGPYTVTEAA
jgi:hypothetical protein